MKSSITGLRRYDWKPVKNVEAPEHFVDDFSSDRGYFTEENGTHDWRIENGVLTTTAVDEDVNLTYIHVYEKNVSFKARVRFVGDAPPNSMLGLLLRYNADEAYCRAGCFTYSGNWYIDHQEGADFPPIRHSIVNHPIESGRWYDLCFTVDGDTGVLTLDGETLISVSDISHTSPGRIGFYAEKLTVEVDSVDIALLSGQGTVWRNVVHHKLPDNKYREGGSVFELRDSTLIYENHKDGDTFKSTDNGQSWERAETWVPPVGYMNVFRLQNGDWIRTAKKRIDDTYYMITRTSSDDGKTWVDGGIICRTQFHGIQGVGAGNMNDKLSQGASGRIYYSQNYESHVGPVDGRIVFCEFYYSDDNGTTWTKSETDSWELGGNEGIVRFGECKILDCDDGTLRMYNSWNDHGCLVYSESHDNGVTWGPLVRMPEFVSARSSMQFVKDVYADNDTTYYMVWVYSEPMVLGDGMCRSRLSMARSENGKDWKFLGDVWRWECGYRTNAHIAHVVDPFIKTTKDYIICGAGFSEQLECEEARDHSYHHAQRQHVYSIRKDALVERDALPGV